jgi:hypothetical protein
MSFRTRPVRGAAPSISTCAAVAQLRRPGDVNARDVDGQWAVIRLAHDIQDHAIEETGGQTRIRE